MRRFAVLFLLLVLGILSFYSYHKYRQHPPETSLVELRRNVYIITASGLRAGHLSSYLYQPIQTPAMDFLAYDGIRFTNAYTSSTDSLAAHLSLLTGIYPIHEPVKQTYEYLLDFTKRGYPKNLTILPEVLSRRGYRTATFLSDPELRYPGFFGIFFHQAFTGDGVVYPWQASYSPATSCKLARDWIKENREKPHFLLLNFDEPSFPFQPPAPYDRQYAKYPYDGEAAGVDEQVGLFVNLLKETGLYQKSIVILTSPYGESLEGESRYSSPHNAVIQVPLIITAPGLLPRHENYDAQVSIVDIVPTILKLLEYSTGTNFDGISLFEKGQQKQISHEYIYGIVPFPELLNFAPECFVRGKGYIYVSGRNEDVISHHNYEITESQRNERLQNGRNLLKNAGWKPGANLAVDLETDPGLLLEQALHLARDQKPEIAMDLLSSFTEDVPRNSYLNSLLGSLAGASDDQESELSYFKAAAENSPTLRPLPALARAQLAAGLPAEALETLKKYKRAVPIMSYDVRSTYALALSLLGRNEEALLEFGTVLKQNSRYAEAYLYRGKIWKKLNHLAEAESDWKMAIEADQQCVAAYEALASLSQERRHPADAIPYLRQLLRFDPDNYEVMLQLALLHHATGNLQDARKLCEQVMLNAQDPKLKEKAKRMLAQIL